MPQVVKANIVQTSGDSNSRPSAINSSAAILDFAANDDVRIFRYPWQRKQNIESLLIEVNDLCTSFAIAKTQETIFKINIAPM